MLRAATQPTHHHMELHETRSQSAMERGATPNPPHTHNNSRPTMQQPRLPYARAAPPIVGAMPQAAEVTPSRSCNTPPSCGRYRSRPRPSDPIVEAEPPRPATSSRRAIGRACFHVAQSGSSKMEQTGVGGCSNAVAWSASAAKRALRSRDGSSSFLILLFSLQQAFSFIFFHVSI
ncbi:hypothetical protein PAHAL_1G151100 [Panicum hallii]|uniref:Uncharacterized protein n=1 Tax=Panicum hallii TaxID=206008 RepID=A0A2T8KVA9_9POAL|nr:hypothetical protein PAHAL_1G151100 [Panicum hallii]